MPRQWFGLLILIITGKPFGLATLLRCNNATLVFLCFSQNKGLAFSVAFAVLTHPKQYILSHRYTLTKEAQGFAILAAVLSDSHTVRMSKPSLLRELRYNQTYHGPLQRYKCSAAWDATIFPSMWVCLQRAKAG